MSKSDKVERIVDLIRSAATKDENGRPKIKVNKFGPLNDGKTLFMIACEEKTEVEFGFDLLSEMAEAANSNDVAPYIRYPEYGMEEYGIAIRFPEDVK